jgi:hypothetical protein
MTKRGMSGKGRWCEGCRHADYTIEHTVAVSERAELEFGVKLGQGDDLKRKAERASLVAQCFLHAMARLFLHFFFNVQLTLSPNSSFFATP